MRKDRLLESILYIINYDYKAVFEQFPVLNSPPVFFQHGPAYLQIDVILPSGYDPYNSVNNFSWNERTPIYKINKYYYDYLKRNKVFDKFGHLNLPDSDIEDIIRIDAHIYTDTEPFVELELFSCSDEGIVEVLKMD